MRQLHTGASSLRVHEFRNAAKVGNVLVFPDAQIARRDAALRGDSRGFKRDEASAALRPAAQMDEVPLTGKAVEARVLAHGRNADAIGELDGAKLEWRKKWSAHVCWMIAARKGFERQQRPVRIIPFPECVSSMV